MASDISKDHPNSVEPVQYAPYTFPMPRSLLYLTWLIHCGLMTCHGLAEPARPNVLFAIADDQSFPHASIYGSTFVTTPAFDRVAREGILFEQAFCPAPGCSPSRASILTGRHIWQNREAGTHASNFPADLKVFTRSLEDQAGYHVGYTGKAWGPGNHQITGWATNPVGKAYNQQTLKAPKGMSGRDYAGNFRAFLEDQPADQPFFFWYGAQEPHRAYDDGVGLRAGKKLEQAEVPGFLPDHPVIRSDLLDYAVEIEWFDRHLGDMISLLEEKGMLENTLIVVTADNGMPFPRAKANLYEYGIHAPMAMRWGKAIEPGRTLEDLVSFVDLAPTFLELAGLPIHQEITGRSLVDLLLAKGSGRLDPQRRWVLSGRERHTHARPDNLGYPSRALRTHRFLLIQNMAPDRWPAGNEFHDIDACPTLSFLQENRSTPQWAFFWEAAMGMRPALECFDILKDPDCMHNLAEYPEHRETVDRLAELLRVELVKQGDPRVQGQGSVFESYPRYSSMRPHLGGFAERGQYNPAFQEP